MFVVDVDDSFGPVPCLEEVRFTIDGSTLFVSASDKQPLMPVVREDPRFLYEKHVDVDFEMRDGRAYATIVRELD